MQKKRKMIFTLIAIYIVVSTIAYFVFGGFYFTKKYSIKNLSENHKSVDQLDISIDKARKGVYVGYSDFKNQKSYLFQFEEMFADKSRLLNVYYPVSKGEIYFIETDKKLSGQDAIFILRKKKSSFSTNERIEEFEIAKIYNSYYKTAKIPNPQLFVKKVGADIKISDDVFVLSLNVNSEKFQNNVQIMLFSKNAYGYYNLKRGEKYFDKNNWELKDKSAKKDEMNNGIVKNILLAIADIITSAIQLIIAFFYYIYLFIRIIIAVFTGGFVK